MAPRGYFSACTHWLAEPSLLNPATALCAGSARLPNPHPPSVCCFARNGKVLQWEKVQRLKPLGPRRMLRPCRLHFFGFWGRNPQRERERCVRGFLPPKPKVILHTRHCGRSDRLIRNSGASSSATDSCDPFYWSSWYVFW